MGREYKYLTQEEVVQYNALSAENLNLVHWALTDEHYLEFPKLKDIQLNKRFHVANGNYDAVLVKEANKYNLKMYEVGSSAIKHTADVTMQYESNNPSHLIIEFGKMSGYLKEVSKILSDKTTFLYSADPNCSHEIEGSMAGGLHCTKCSGWDCA